MREPVIAGVMEIRLSRAAGRWDQALIFAFVGS
jgi:hypothetical protein